MLHIRGAGIWSAIVPGGKMVAEISSVLVEVRGARWKHMPRWIADWLRRERRRRCVACLTDRQLLDAGIDPVLAGRGRAVACENPERVSGVGY